MSTEIESLSDSLSDLEEAGENLVVTETQSQSALGLSPHQTVPTSSKDGESQVIPVADSIAITQPKKTPDPKDTPEVVPPPLVTEADVLTVLSTGEEETDGSQSQDLYGSLTEGDSDCQVKQCFTDSLNVSINQPPLPEDIPTAVIPPSVSKMSDPAPDRSQSDSPELKIIVSPLTAPQAASGTVVASSSSTSSTVAAKTPAVVSQPLATQDVLSGFSQPLPSTAVTAAATQFELTVATIQSPTQQPDRPRALHSGGLIIPSDSPTCSLPHSPNQVNSSQQSVFVALKTSPKKRPIVELFSEDDASVPNVHSKVDRVNTAEPNKDDSPPILSISGDIADTEPPSSSAKSDSQSSANSVKSDGVSPLKPPKKRVRHCIESQDPYTFTSQDPNELSQELPSTSKLKPSSKTKKTSDGRTIQYSAITKRQVTQIEYRNDKGEIVYKEYEEFSSPHSAHSSGYMGDRSSGLSGSTSSQYSEELILKTHRSAEDGLFVSTCAPEARKRNVSAPPQPKSLKKDPPPLPKPENLQKVLVFQQARSILASVNGHAKRRSKLNASTLTPPSANTTVSPVQNLSEISAITGASGLKVTPPAMNLFDDEADTASAPLDSPVAGEVLPELKSSKENLPVIPSTSYRTAAPTFRSPAHPPKPTKRKRRQTRKCSGSGSSLSPPTSGVRSTRNLPAPHKGELVTEARVVAKWPSDGHFYFGHVIDKATLDKWSILFDDGNTTKVLRKDILVIDSLPCGYSVLARLDQDYLPALVLECLDCTTYKVKFTEEQMEHRVTSVDICLDAAQFTNLQLRNLAQRSTDSDGDRFRVNFSSRRGVKTSTPTPLKKTISHTAGSALKRSEIFTDLQRSPVKQRKPSQSKPDAVPSTSRGLTFGETSTNSADVFQGFIFLVTSLRKSRVIDKVTERQCLEDKTETDSQTTDAGEEEVVVDKDAICAKIEHLGGIVIDKFDQEMIMQATKSFLISATFQRTVKYLQCLAANIPPVSYQWVEMCYNSRHFESPKDFLLPAGVEVRTGEVIEWKEKRRCSPLKDVTIFVAGEDDSTFQEDWRGIITAAGAQLVKKISAVCGIKPHVMLVGNKGCSKSMLNQARRHSIPTVSPEWVIQQLITGVQLPYDYHPSFTAATHKAF